MSAGERGVFDSYEVADVNIREASAGGLPFLSPFLCGMTKKWHPCRHSAARSCTRVKRRSCLNFAFYPRARHNAARCASLLLLGVPQEVAKKGTKGTPLGTPLPDGFSRAAGAFAFASLLHLGRMSARPRWVRFGQNFCFLCLPLVLAKIEAQHQRLLCDLSSFSL